MSLMLTVTDQEKMLRWSALRCNDGGADWPGDSEAMGVVETDSGRIVAVMVLNGFMQDMAMVHFASDGGRRWASRSILGGLFGYVFIFKGIGKLVTMTDSTNIPVQKLWLGLGFQIEGTIRKSRDGGNRTILATMFREECDWITEGNKDHG